MGGALVVRSIADAESLINGEEQNFLAVADSDKDVNFKKEAGYALQALQKGSTPNKNSYLLQTAMNNPLSLKNAITNVSAIGLSINPALKLGYLVPMDNAVQLFVSWKGYIALATRSGSILYAHVELVYEKDVFHMKGMSEQPEHTRDPFATDRGKVVGGYCSARLPCGDYMTSTMTIQELNKIKDLSKAKTGPWKTWPDEMMKKTIVKRASKLWPESKDIRLAEAINLSNKTEGIDFDAKEKERQEKHEEYLQERRDIIKMETEKKKLLMADIMNKASELTDGKSMEEKGHFMIDRLRVNSFDDLKRKKIEELEEILGGLNGQ